MGIEHEIGPLLVDQELTLATAESCTGGLLAHRITNVPGSSAYYLGGLIAYANETKQALLGVRSATLMAHGAVSEEAALEMARGARERIGSDVALATTGIAGPGGGTVEKPVGLVYIALSAVDFERCEQHVWPGEGEVDERLANKCRSVDAALALLVAYLEGQAR